MKISTFLAGLFFAGMVVFAILYFTERDARPQQPGWLVTVRQKLDSIRAADSIQQKATAGIRPEKLHPFFSQTFDDVNLAKAYIKNFQSMAAGLQGALTTAGLPALTKEIWMDSASICSLGRLITQYKYDGLRLYLAEYADIKTHPDPKRPDGGKYDFHITMVAVTTKSDPETTHKDNHIDVYTDPVTNAISGLVNYHDVCPPTCPNGNGDVLAQP